MKLSDLKTGMWAKTRDGCMYLVLRDHVSIGDGIFIDNSGFLKFKNYNDEMIDVDSTEYDIIEVFIPYLDTYTLNGDVLTSIWKRKQKPELTPFEKEFLKALKPEYRNGCIARDKGGDLYAYDREPIKNELGWVSRYCYKISDFANFPLFSRESFTWCQWEDEEPWYIPDLLKEA